MWQLFGAACIGIGLIALQTELLAPLVTMGMLAWSFYHTHALVSSPNATTPFIAPRLAQVLMIACGLGFAAMAIVYRGLTFQSRVRRMGQRAQREERRLVAEESKKAKKSAAVEEDGKKQKTE